MYVVQNNYTEDEEHQLHDLCGRGALLLMTLHEEEGGSYTSRDEQVVEEEEEETFLQDFSGNVDETPEEMKGDIEYAKACFPYALANYLEEHPEYTGIEYNGEMHTAEELDDIASEQIAALFMDEIETEAQ